MSVDTKAAREVADREWFGGLATVIRGTIHELSDEVDRLRKELSSALGREWTKEDRYEKE